MNREPHVERNESAFDPTEAVRSLRRESAEWLRIVGVGIAIVVGIGAVVVVGGGIAIGGASTAERLFARALEYGPVGGPLLCVGAIAGLWISVLAIGHRARLGRVLVLVTVAWVSASLIAAVAIGVAVGATWPANWESRGSGDPMLQVSLGSFFWLGYTLSSPVRGFQIIHWWLPWMMLLGFDPRISAGIIAIALMFRVRAVPELGPARRTRALFAVWGIQSALVALFFLVPSSVRAMLFVSPTTMDAILASLGIVAGLVLGGRRRQVDPGATHHLARIIRAVVAAACGGIGAVWLARGLAEFAGMPRLELPHVQIDDTMSTPLRWLIPLAWIIGSMLLVARFVRPTPSASRTALFRRRPRRLNHFPRFIRRRPAFAVSRALWSFASAPLLVTALAWNYRAAPFESTRLLAVDAPLDAMDIKSTEFVALAPVTEIPEGDAYAEAEPGVRKGFVDLERWGDAYVVHGLRFDGEPQSGSLAEADDRTSLVGFVGRGRLRFRVGWFDGDDDDEIRELNQVSLTSDYVTGRMSVRELDLGAAVLLRRDPSWPEDWKQRLELAPSGRFTLRVTDDGIARADDVTIDGLSIDAWLAQSPR